MPIAENHRNAPIVLWCVASRLLITLFDLFGEPQELCFRHTLLARDHKAALNWLRTVEALLRKRLFIEASFCANDFKAAKPRAKRKRAARGRVLSGQARRMACELSGDRGSYQ